MKQIFKLGVKKVNWTYTKMESESRILTEHILPLYLDDPEVKAISIQKEGDSNEQR